jgi:hypothetical protein
VASVGKPSKKLDRADAGFDPVRRHAVGPNARRHLQHTDPGVGIETDDRDSSPVCTRSPALRMMFACLLVATRASSPGSRQSYWAVPRETDVSAVNKANQKDSDLSPRLRICVCAFETTKLSSPRFSPNEYKIGTTSPFRACFCVL